MRRALSHREPDRVPVSDFFWVGFLKCWRLESGLPHNADIYTHYDHDGREWQDRASACSLHLPCRLSRRCWFEPA
jgi:hypothetical protein